MTDLKLPLLNRTYRHYLGVKQVVPTALVGAGPAALVLCTALGGTRETIRLADFNSNYFLIATPDSKEK